MCAGQTKWGTPVEEQTMGGTPSEESTTGGAPGGDDFVDKLPIRAKARMGSELSVESSESPSKELSKEGSWTGGKNPYERANGNFGDTRGEGKNQEKAPGDVDALNSHSGRNPIESLHLMELKTL